MAKGNIPISDARRIGEARSQPVVVVFGVDEGGQRYNVTTWGKTKRLCGWAATVGNEISKAIADGKVMREEHAAADPYQQIAALQKRYDELFLKFTSLAKESLERETTLQKRVEAMEKAAVYVIAECEWNAAGGLARWPRGATMRRLQEALDAGKASTTKGDQSGE